MENVEFEKETSWRRRCLIAVGATKYQVNEGDWLSVENSDWHPPSKGFTPERDQLVITS